MARLDRYFCAHMTRTFPRSGLFALLGVLLLSGCTLNRDIMFKTPTDYEFSQFSDSGYTNLRLQANDQIQFRLFANDGFKMIDLVSEGGTREASFLQRTSFLYFIDNLGSAKLPLLGKVRLAGMTLREAETFLESKYVDYYNRPFVQLLVESRRVVVFPGEGGDARSVALENNNTTLLEVIGMAGGLSNRGNAKKVKVFRYDTDRTRKVYQFDLSTIDGLKYADMVMQGDDVVYVQPNAEIARGIVRDLSPIVTLLTSLVLIYSISRTFK